MGDTGDGYPMIVRTHEHPCDTPHCACSTGSPRVKISRVVRIVVGATNAECPQPAGESPGRLGRATGRDGESRRLFGRRKFAMRREPVKLSHWFRVLPVYLIEFSDAPARLSPAGRDDGGEGFPIFDCPGSDVPQDLLIPTPAVRCRTRILILNPPFSARKFKNYFIRRGTTVCLKIED